MKKLLPPLLPPILPLLISLNANAQINCMTTDSMQICPPVTWLYETNFSNSGEIPILLQGKTIDKEK